MAEELPTHSKNNLDALRLFSAIAVMLFHSFTLCQQGEADWLGRITHGVYNSGYVAVNIFFIISGYLIAGSWVRSKSTFDFLRRRACRIFPGYIVATTLSIFVVACGIEHLSVRSPVVHELIRQALRMDALDHPGIFKNAPRSGPLGLSLWTIRYEFLCYLFLMTLGLASLLRFRAGTVVIWVASFGLTWVAHHHRFPRRVDLVVGHLSAWSRFLPLFLSGTVFYLFRRSVPFRWWGFATAMGVLLLPVLVRHELPAIVGNVAGTYALLYVGFNRSLPFQDFGRYGDFSYGIYLYACPVEQLILNSVRATPLTLFAYAIVPVAACGIGSWYGVERYFTRKKSSSGRTTPLSSSSEAGAPASAATGSPGLAN